MKTVEAVVRVTLTGELNVLAIPHEPSVEVATLLIRRALAEQPLQPGVFHVRVLGESRTPDIEITSLARSDQAFARVRCCRDGANSVVVLEAILSAPQPDDEKRLANALPEATASAMRDAPLGQERWIDVVL